LIELYVVAISRIKAIHENKEPPLNEKPHFQRNPKDVENILVKRNDSLLIS
jgi:hypothetical protein